MFSLPKYVLICLVVLAVAVWTAPVSAANEDAALFQEALGDLLRDVVPELAAHMK